MYAPTYDFNLVKQESIAREKFSRNEVQKDTHVVAKGALFVVQFSCGYLANKSKKEITKNQAPT
jgi:hypothetical protein